MRIGLVLLIGLSVSVVLAQTAVVEPEFADVFMELSSGKLVPLERESAAIKSGAGGFMVAGAKAAWDINGDHSSVRLQAHTPLQFVVKSGLTSTSVDPSSQYVLRRMTIHRKNREIVFMKGRFTPIGGSANTNLSNGVIPVSFARYGASSYLIQISSLEPGEYALSRAYGQDLFCFGID